MSFFRRICQYVFPELGLALGLAVVVACGGGGGTPPPVPVTIAISPAIAQATAGDSIQFSAVLSGTSNQVVDWRVAEGASGGTITASGLYTTPATEGTYHIVGTSQASSSVVATAGVTVQPRPAIASFTVSPNSISLGGQAALQATFSGGSGTLDNGAGTIFTGNAVQVTPSATTIYTLSVANVLGVKVTRSVTLTVLAQPVISSFVAAANPINVGSSTTLTSTFVGGTGTINQGLGPTSSGLGLTVTPATTTTYTLTVSNTLGGVVTQSLTLAVLPLPTITTFAAASPAISLGGSTTLTAVFAGGTGSVNGGVNTIISGTPVSVSPAATITYALTVTSVAGAKATATTTVTVTNGPAITTFAAASPQVNAGQSTTLNWVVTGNPTALTLDGVSVLSGPSSIVVLPKQRQTYTLRASNAQGSSSASVTVVARGLDLLTGDVGGPGSLDGTGAAAQFDQAGAGVSDPLGNVYICDTQNHAIRKVTAAGVVTTIAGRSGIPGFSDGISSAALFRSPKGICRDAAGNLYVADTGNEVIRKIAVDGSVSTLAGTVGVGGYNDGPAAQAIFNSPFGIAVNSSGTLFVADRNNHVIRSLSTAQVVTTLAGLGTQFGSLDGTGANALFFWPMGLILNGSGDLVVADSGNSTLREITPAGVVTTLAGIAQSSGSADGTNLVAKFNTATALYLEPAGTILVADTGNHTFRRVTSAGAVTTIFGQAGVAGYQDGRDTNTLFNSPAGIVVRPGGSILLVDSGNYLLRSSTVDGIVSTLAGTPYRQGSANGTLLDSRYLNPQGMALGSDGTLYIADTGNQTLRKISPNGQVTKLAGQVGVVGSADGFASATFNGPQAIAVDGAGNVYVADTGNHTIRKVLPSGEVQTFAGKAGNPGNITGPGSSARFDRPSGIAVDANGNIYVADTNNQVIQIISPGGMVSTFAGVPRQQGYIDSRYGAATFTFPQGVAFGPSGNLLVADTGSGLIRTVSPAGYVVTLAGLGGVFGSADGDGFLTRFAVPIALSADSAGNIFVIDRGGNTLRKVLPDGTTSTIAGNPGQEGIRLGPLPGGLFRPFGIAVTPQGDVLVTTGNGVVQVTGP